MYVVKLDLDVLFDVVDALLVLVGLIVVEVDVDVSSVEIQISFEPLYSS